MDPQVKPAEKQPSLPSYCKTWAQFTDRAMPLLVQNPTETRYTLKYIPRRNAFVLKVTDGAKTAMKRCNASEEYVQIQNFTRLATKALTNEAEQEKKIEMVEQKGGKGAKKKGKNK